MLSDPSSSGIGVLDNKENLPWSVYVGVCGMPGRSHISLLSGEAYFHYCQGKPRTMAGMSSLTSRRAMWSSSPQHPVRNLPTSGDYDQLMNADPKALLERECVYIHHATIPADHAVVPSCRLRRRRVSR